MIAIKALDYLVRVAGAAALILGFALWGGQLYALLNLQMGLGVAVVLALWVLAIWRYAAARLVALLWEAFLGVFLRWRSDKRRRDCSLATYTGWSR